MFPRTAQPAPAKRSGQRPHRTVRRERGFEEALRTLPLDYRALRCASTTDFVRIAEARPDLLRREAL